MIKEVLLFFLICTTFAQNGHAIAANNGGNGGQTVNGQQNCENPLDNGKTCDDGRMCTSGFCINAICSASEKIGNCKTDEYPADGFFCKAGTVTACVKDKQTCTGNSLFECCAGICNLATKLCDTYVAGQASKPALQGGDANGFKTCTQATFAADCTYKQADKAVTPPGFACLPTLHATTQSFFCQMGGGETIFNSLAQQVTKIYANRFSSIKTILRNNHSSLSWVNLQTNTKTL